MFPPLPTEPDGVDLVFTIAIVLIGAGGAAIMLGIGLIGLFEVLR